MHERKRPTAPEKTIKDLPSQQYPNTQREYEKLMQHDAYRRVKGRVRQTKWGERS